MTELEQAGEAGVDLDVPEAGGKHTEPQTGWGQLPPRGSCGGPAATATEAWTRQEEGCTCSPTASCAQVGPGMGRGGDRGEEEGTSPWMEEWLCPRHTVDQTLGKERALRPDLGSLVREPRCCPRGRFSEVCVGGGARPCCPPSPERAVAADAVYGSSARCSVFK